MGGSACVGREGVLNDRNLSFYSSGGQRSKIKVLVSPAVFLLGLQMAVLSLCPHVGFPLCVCISVVLCVSKFPFLK